MKRSRIPMLVATNAILRIGASASGQLFAFYLAEEHGGARGAWGSIAVGAIGACFYLTELIGGPIAGKLADTRGQGRVLVLGPMFGAVSTLLAAAGALIGGHGAAIVLWLGIARVAEGSSAACAVPTTLALLARWTDGDALRRSRVMGLFEVTSVVGMISGYVVAGLAWDAFGAYAFALLTPVYLVSWLLAAVATRGLAPEPTDGVATRAGSLLQTAHALAARTGAMGFAVSWLSVNAVVGLWLQHSPYLFKLSRRSASQRLVGGFSGSEISAIFGGFGVLFFVGTLLWAFLAASWPRRRSLGIALVGMLGVVAALFAVNHGGPTEILWLAGACVLIESGYTPAALATLADQTAERDESRGAAMGIYSLMLSGGQLIGNVVGSPFAAQWQMDGVLAATALLAAIALIGVARMPRTT